MTSIYLSILLSIFSVFDAQNVHFRCSTYDPLHYPCNIWWKNHLSGCSVGTCLCPFLWSVKVSIVLHDSLTSCILILLFVSNKSERLHYSLLPSLEWINGYPFLILELYILYAWNYLHVPTCPTPYCQYFFFSVSSSFRLMYSNCQCLKKALPLSLAIHEQEMSVRIHPQS